MNFRDYDYLNEVSYNYNGILKEILRCVYLDFMVYANIHGKVCLNHGESLVDNVGVLLDGFIKDTFDFKESLKRKSAMICIIELLGTKPRPGKFPMY